MIDLHTHSLFSDGELLPSELIRRAYVAGYKAFAITDHVDASNIDFVLPRIIEAVNSITGYIEIKVLAGIEITHVPPKLIEKLVLRARSLGAKIIVAHGETIAEPVASGTNRAAIGACVDILAHPGLITEEDVIKARENHVALEITARKGHSFTNGHVSKLAVNTGATLVVNTDAHAPQDLITLDWAKVVLHGAGVDEERIEQIFANSEEIVNRIS